MKNSFIHGVMTAMITPMADDKIDLKAFNRMLLDQKKSGVASILLFGTTGESLSLKPNEKTALFYNAKNVCGALPVVCGISSPVTQNAVQSAKCLTNLGADALLVVTPYYYRCTSEGIYRHFKAISDETDLPIIIYNVPARTSFNLNDNKDLYDDLSGITNVCAIKNAVADRAETLALVKRSKISVLSGNDENNLFNLSVGGTGSVSVLSNLLPELECAMHSYFLNGKKEKAIKINEFLKTVGAIFGKQPNPIAIKYACSIKYEFSPGIRLPLTAPSGSYAEELKNITLKALKMTEELL